MEWLADPSVWIALATLTALEIVLGIDNIIFISILVGRLPAEQRDRARILGLSLAMGMRLLLLFSISWVMGLTADLFSLFGHGISGRDLIMIIGGLFLLGKSTHEIHAALEAEDGEKSGNTSATFNGVLIQIAVIDLVFSFDSVITAVGLVEQISVMVIAIVISVGVMMLASKAISDFVEEHPTFKMLALSFLILVGFALVGEGLGLHIPKGYIYFAMAFSVGVELLNMRVRAMRKRKHQPVRLHKPIRE